MSLRSMAICCCIVAVASCALAEEYYIKDPLPDRLPPNAIARFGSDRLRHGAKHFVFAPHGKSIYTGISDRYSPSRVTEWNLATGNVLRHFPGFRQGLGAIGVSGDGSRLAVIGVDKDQRSWLHIYDASTAERLHRVEVDSGNTMARAADGRTFASAGKTIRLWDIHTGKIERMLPGSPHGISSLVFADADQTLIAASEAFKDDQARGAVHFEVQFWNLKTGHKDRSERFRIMGKDDARGVSGTQLATDRGRELAIASADGMVRLWSLERNQVYRHFSEPRAAKYPIAIYSPAPDKSLVSSGWRSTKVTGRDIEEGPVLLRRWGLLEAVDAHCNQISKRCVFSPDGKYVCLGGNSFWHLRSGKVVSLLGRVPPGHEGSVRAFAFSNDGTMLATVGDEPHAEDDDRTIRLWDLDTARQILRVGDRYRYTKGNVLAFSADDRTLMIDGPKGQFLNVRDGRIFDGFLPGKPGQSDYFDATPRTYHSRGPYKGRPQLDLDAARINYHTGKARNSGLLALSPDERLRVQNRVRKPQSANTPTVIEIVDSQSGKAICALELATERQDEGRGRTTHYGRFDFLAFSNNNEFLHGLVDHDSRSSAFTFRDERSAIYTWDVKTGKRVRTSPARSGIPVFITPDGRAVVMRDWDSLWLVETATMQHILDVGYVANLETVTMDPAGRRLVTAGFGAGAIVVWSLVGDATHWEAAAKLDAAGIETLWKQLAHDNAELAYRAVCLLAATGDRGVAMMKKHLSPSVKSERRTMPPQPAKLQRSRAVWALEIMQSAAALRLLKNLAAGADGDYLTTESKKAVARVERQTARRRFAETGQRK